MAKYFKSFIAKSFELKTLTIKLLVIAFAFVGMASCDNSDNIGDLLGQWKLEQITYNGVTTIPEEQVYLRFQSQYVEALTVNRCQITGHYTNTGSTMTLKFYYPEESFGDLNNYYNFYNDESIARTQEEVEKDVHPLNIQFKVETLSSDMLILSNDNGLWIFSKW